MSVSTRTSSSVASTCFPGVGATLRALNPLTHLAICLGLLAAALFTGNAFGVLVVFCVYVMLACAAGAGLSYLSLVFKAIALLVAMVFVLQVLLYQGESPVIWQLGPLVAKRAGLARVISLSSTLLAITAAVALLPRLTDIRRLVIALECRGLPPKAGYVVLSTVQVVPDMRRHSRTITDAQRSRGVETEGGLAVRARAFVPLLIPLVLSSIVAIEERALMLEARGFAGARAKTYLEVPGDDPIDRAVRLASLLLPLAVFLWRVTVWLI